MRRDSTSRPTGSVPRRKTWPPTGVSDGARRVAVLLARAVRRDDVGEQGDEDEQHDDGEADDGAAMAPEVAPQLGRRRRRRRRLRDHSAGGRRNDGAHWCRIRGLMTP
jgi:hypothetical protein